MSENKLKKFVEMTNIATELDESELLKHGMRALSGFREDEQSITPWLNEVKQVMEVASLVGGPKNTPLPNSANIKFPLITKACYQFSSMTYPEIIKDGKIVKARVIGKDVEPLDSPESKTAQADRVSAYMNYQLLCENQDWELELDRSLNLLALIGFVCKKTYYDPIRDQIKSELCDHKDLIIHADTKCLYDAQRISHVLRLTLNDLIEASRAGVYCEDTVEELLALHSDSDDNKVIEVIEQHCFIDLDGDRYSEPYIITILKDTGKVLRLVARYDENDIEMKKGKVAYIKAQQFFTDYHFLVSPKGKFQSVGFGSLMLSLNKTINTILNQLVDAGQLANIQGGYIDSRFKPIESGNSLHDPGEFKKIKLNGPDMRLQDGIMPITFKEPSQVLMQLLNTLIESGKELSASTEAMTGGGSTENSKTGATLSKLEQSLKTFTAIQRRIHRSLGQEFKKVFDLNAKYLDPAKYIEILDDELSIKQTDFDSSKVSIVPISDPNLSSEVQRQAKAQMLMAMVQLPGVNPVKITERLVMSMPIENPKELMADPQQQQPNPEVIKIQADIEEKAQLVNLKGRELDIEEKRLELELMKTQSEIELNKAKAMQAAAMADQAASSTQLRDNELQLKTVTAELDAMLQHNKMVQEDLKHQRELQHEAQENENDRQVDGGSVSAVETSPGDAESVEDTGETE